VCSCRDAGTTERQELKLNDAAVVLVVIYDEQTPAKRRAVVGILSQNRNRFMSCQVQDEISPS